MPLVQLADSYMHIYPKQIKDQKELSLTSSVDVEIHNQQVFETWCGCANTDTAARSWAYSYDVVVVSQVPCSCCKLRQVSI